MSERHSTFIRVLSSLIMVGALYLVFWLWKSTGLAVLGATLVMVAQWEYARMFFRESSNKEMKVVFQAAGFLVLYFGIWSSPEIWLWAMPVCFVMMTATIFIRSVKLRGLESAHQNVSLSALGFIYLGIMPVLTMRLLVLPNGIAYFCTLLAAVFAGDTFAFFIGVKFGKRKLWSIVSPKKSWEGAFGGLLGSVLATTFCGMNFIPEIPIIVFVITGIICGVAGQMGDLFESMLKRIAGVKDSGSIMPGHGGLLDRIDGVLFAGVVFWPLIIWWGGK